MSALLLPLAYLLVLSFVSSQVITRLAPSINDEAYFRGSQRSAFGIGVMYSVGLALISLILVAIEANFGLRPAALNLIVYLTMICFPTIFLTFLSILAPRTYSVGTAGTACGVGLLLLLVNWACAALVMGFFAALGFPVPV